MAIENLKMGMFMGRLSSILGNQLRWCVLLNIESVGDSTHVKAVAQRFA